MKLGTAVVFPHHFAFFPLLQGPMQSDSVSHLSVVHLPQLQFASQLWPQPVQAPPAGVGGVGAGGAGVGVAGAGVGVPPLQRSVHSAMQALYAAGGFEGQRPMQAESDPPGQLGGTGPGAGVGVAGAGVGLPPPPHHLALPPLLQLPMHCASDSQPGLVLQWPQMQLASQL